MRKLGILLIFLAAMPMSAHAEKDKAYWGIMLGSVEYDDPIAKIYGTGLSGRVGYDFITYLGIEGRLLTSSAGNDAGITNLKVDYMASLFGKLNIPMNKTRTFNFYGLLGYSAMKMSYSLGRDLYFTDNGLSYGLGFDFYADDRNGFNIEWVRYLDQTKSGTDYTVSQLGIGYIRRF